MVNPELSLPVIRQCGLLRLARSTFYYEATKNLEKDQQIMPLIDRCHLEYPFYGSRRIRVWLIGQGYNVNRKRVQRLMRLMAIEASYPKKKLSLPGENHKIYPYLLRGLDIVRPNQVWATDITYIPMAKGHVYLVAVVDWFSRRVLSWRLSTTMDSSFCVDALEEAIETYGSPEIFNTDQGSQFTSANFTDVLIEHSIKISMDGKGRWIDNVIVERLWRSVKYEEVYLKAYDTVRHARESLGSYFVFYNSKRTHQSLDYQTPDEVYYPKAVSMAA